MTRLTLPRRTLLATAAATLPIAGPSAMADPTAPRPDLAHDRLRPQCHLLPPRNWMNDPCGPILHNGAYHMFYQHDPAAPVPANIVWGHATSPDLLAWRHQPVALTPGPDAYDKDGVWTGSVVIDGATPTALYTGNPGEQVCRATADPTLQRWTKSGPVALPRPPGLALTGFRDPQAWSEPQPGHDGARWRLVIGAGVAGKGGHVLAYSADDLTSWRHEGTVYEEPDTRDIVCECPDLFPLGGRHLLLYSNRGTTHFIIGDLDGVSLKPTGGGRLDFGLFYAAKTLRDADGQRIVFGWIGEDRPPEAQRAAGWAGVMSLPRRLALLPDGTLSISFIPSLQTLHGRRISPADQVDAPCVRLVATLRGPAKITLAGRNGAFATIAYDAGALSVNERTTPLAANPDGSVPIDAVIDASVIECLAGTATCLTARTYRDPTGPFRLIPEGGVATLVAHELQPISRDRLSQ